MKGVTLHMFSIIMAVTQQSN